LKTQVTDIQKRFSSWSLLNIYTILIVSFLCWVTFFDSNNLFVLKAINEEVNETELQKEYYEETIERTKQARKDILNNAAAQRDYAIENHYRQFPNSDVYVPKVKSKK